MPELAGDPDKPEISYLFESSLFFKRMADAGCPITGVPEEIMQHLRPADKMLIIEVDLDKVVDLNDGKIADPVNVFKRYYEATINRDSFSENAIDTI